MSCASSKADSATRLLERDLEDRDELLRQAEAGADAAPCGGREADVGREDRVLEQSGLHHSPPVRCRAARRPPAALRLFSSAIWTAPSSVSSSVQQLPDTCAAAASSSAVPWFHDDVRPGLRAATRSVTVSNPGRETMRVQPPRATATPTSAALARGRMGYGARRQAASDRQARRASSHGTLLSRGCDACGRRISTGRTHGGRSASGEAQSSRTQVRRRAVSEAARSAIETSEAEDRSAAVRGRGTSARRPGHAARCNDGICIPPLGASVSWQWLHAGSWSRPVGAG